MHDRDLPAYLEPGAAFDSLRWNSEGLLPVMAIDRRSGEPLMAAHTNRQTLSETLRTGWATYWSRSRAQRWLKGESSGHRQRVVEVRADCDGDALLYLVDADGPACHTGRRSCFSWRIDADASITCDRPVLR